MYNAHTESRTYNLNRKRAVGTAEIVLFQSIDTRFGRLYWNPGKLGLASLAGVAGGTVGLFCGALMGLESTAPLMSSLITVASSALLAALSFFSTLKA